VIGKTISHYRITAKLGEGGMGVVYRAEDTKLGRDVALKFLPPEWTRDPDAKARFLHEARAAAALNHPNICTIYEVDEVDDQTFIAMDLVEGESLKDRIERGPVKVSDALNLAIQIADGLAAAHAKDIVHRDVKPGNVMLTREARARIMDFGLAKVRGQTRLTKTGSTTGTVAYMSPEQSLAEDVDHRTDIWSFGVLLYEMVTGRRPFRGDYDQAIVHAILSEEPEPMTGVRTGVPVELERIAKKAMTKRVDERYQHMDEALADLKALKRTLESGTITTPAAVSQRPLERVSRSTARRRVLIGALILAAAAIAAVLVVPRLSHRAPPPGSERVVVAAFENRTGDPSLDPIGSMAADWITSGIAEADIVSVVPAVTVAKLSATAARGGADAAAAQRALAKNTGANIVVSGSYYLNADKLEFRADITDVARGVLIRAIPAFSGPRMDPMAAIEQVRQKVMGTLAVHVGAGSFGMLGEGATPPTYDAFREYSTGLRFFVSDPQQALPHFQRAAAMDTSFISPRFYTMISYAYMDQYAKADSVLRAISRGRSRLTPYEALFLDMQQAFLRGNYNEALRMLRRLEALAPSDMVVKYVIASMSLSLNRPREAAAALSSLDEHPEIKGMYAGSLLYTTWATALDLLGEHEKELAVVRRAREAYPDVTFLRAREARALAGLGRLSEVTALVDEALAAPWTPQSTPGGVMDAAAVALRVHGYRRESIEMANREVAWRKARVEGKSVADDPASYALLANSLYQAEQWDEARATFEKLASLDTTDPNAKAYLGLLAARTGDKGEAERILEELRQSHRRYSFGKDVYAAACIAAQLGDRERAVELLRTSFAQGWDMAPGPLWDMDLEPLHGYAPFEELMKPKG
jgi:tetratricopeptide (TPR) repeat protein/predicted Ser/Thr protein kinase